MMLDEYMTQIKRLIEVFGVKNFPEERISTLWQKVKHEDFMEFQKATDKIILERYTPPPASEILNAIKEEKRNRPQKKWEEVNFDCSWCGQSGFVTARLVENTNHVVAFRCACEWFSYKAKGQFMSWNHSLKDKFFPEFYRFQDWSDRPEKMEHFNDPSGETQRKLATKYAPEIMEMLKGIGRLPYDPNERIN